MFIIAEKKVVTEYSIRLKALIDAGKTYNKARAEFLKLRLENNNITVVNVLKTHQAMNIPK
jgi:hypothetical protein